MLTWSPRTSPFDNNAVGQRGAYSPALSRIVVGGDPSSGNAIQTSDDDGQTWATRACVLDRVFDVAWSPSLALFVAAGIGGFDALASSPDGITWTGRGVPFVITDFGQCVVWDESQALFVASGRGFNGTSKIIATSPDGLAWTAATTDWDGIAFAEVLGITYSSALSLWLAVGNHSGESLLTSPNAATWTVVSPGPFDGSGAGRDIKVAPDGVTIVAAGVDFDDATAISTSVDAVAWAPISSPLDSATANVLAVKDALIVAAGSGGIIMESTDNGATWSADTSDFDSVCRGILFGATAAIASGKNADNSITTLSSGGPLTATRTFDAHQWKFIVADLRTTRTLTAITTLMSDVTTERLLGEAWPAAMAVPADDPRVRTVYEGDTFNEPFVAEGVRCLLGFRDTGLDPLWEIAYTGIILQADDVVEDGIPVTHLSAWDLRKYLESVPVCKSDGTLAGTNGLVFASTKANVIARALITNAVAGAYGDLLAVLLDTSGDDEDCAELDITFQVGSSIAEAWSELERTGAIDIVLKPFYDPRAAPGIISTLNTYAEAGQERAAAIFGWDRSPRSLTGVGRLEDGTQRSNLVQFYDANGNTVTLASDATSIAKYGPYLVQRAFPGQPDSIAVAALADLQNRLRKNGKTTVSVEPTPQRAAQPVQGYDIGDRVRLEVSESLRKPLSAFVRIYGVPIDIGSDAAESVTALRITTDAV